MVPPAPRMATGARAGGGGPVALGGLVAPSAIGAAESGLTPSLDACGVGARVPEPIMAVEAVLVLIDGGASTR